MPVGRVVIYTADFCVTNISLRNGIVLWELQEQECQQHVCQHSAVVLTGQAGWRLLILQLKKVKFKRESALVIVIPIANTIEIFLWKTVDSTLSTNFVTHLGVNHATVEQIQYEAKNSRINRTHKLILRYTYFRDFAKSSFYDDR